MKRFLLPFVALLAATGCGDSSPSPVASEASRDCERLTTCDLGNNQLDRAEVTSANECAAQRQADLRNDGGLDAYIADGSVAVNQANLDACNAELAASPCADFDSVPACNAIYTGTRGEGEACSVGQQCVSGACNAFPGQCGTCLAPANIGETCDITFQNCVSSTEGTVTCQPGLPLPTCVLDPRDHLTVGLNENCGDADGVVRTCASPYYCNDNNVCSERDPAGTACNPNFDSCELTAVCVQSGLGATCLTIVDVTAVDQPCGDLGNDTYGRCDSSLDLYCNPDTDTCHMLAGAGAENSDCLKDADCASGLICVDAGFNDPGKCASTNKPIDTPCDVDAECASRSCTLQPGDIATTCSAPLTCP